MAESLVIHVRTVLPCTICSDAPTTAVFTLASDFAITAETMTRTYDFTVSTATGGTIPFFP